MNKRGSARAETEADLVCGQQTCFCRQELELDLKGEQELQTLQESGPGLAGGRESLGAVSEEKGCICLFREQGKPQKMLRGTEMVSLVGLWRSISWERNVEVLQPKITRNTPVVHKDRVILLLQQGEGTQEELWGVKDLGFCQGILNRNSGSGDELCVKYSQQFSERVP